VNARLRQLNDGSISAEIRSQYRETFRPPGLGEFCA
jgi:hypothetical protein